MGHTYTVFDASGVPVRSGEVYSPREITVQAVNPGETAKPGIWSREGAQLQKGKIIEVNIPDRLPAITVEQVKAHAARMLRYSDWQVIKSFETGSDIPRSVRKERQKIRDASGVIELMKKIPQDFQNEKYWT